MVNVITIKALHDNYIYLYEYAPGQALAVDPCDAGIVLMELERHKLALTTVLVTHHHWDHMGGVKELKAKSGCEVVGGDGKRIPDIDREVGDGDVINLGEERIEVIVTAGHTRTSVCYYLHPAGHDGVVWTGDTMFVGGCGRLFECGAEVMWESLERLAGLGYDTLVYCGHNYTAENYEFAFGIEPGNEAIKKRLLEGKKADNEGRATVPSTIRAEKEANIFLRAGVAEVKAAVGMEGASDVEVFAELRRRKDFF
ncbi:MAG: hydroxyacylglutathione hydrolase [Planctomycetota bacterium]